MCVLCNMQEALCVICHFHCSELDYDCCFSVWMRLSMMQWKVLRRFISDTISLCFFTAKNFPHDAFDSCKTSCTAHTYTHFCKRILFVCSLFRDASALSQCFEKKKNYPGWMTPSSISIPKRYPIEKLFTLCLLIDVLLYAHNNCVRAPCLRIDDKHFEYTLYFCFDFAFNKFVLVSNMYKISTSSFRQSNIKQINTSKDSMSALTILLKRHTLLFRSDLQLSWIIWNCSSKCVQIHKRTYTNTLTLRSSLAFISFLLIFSCYW